AELEPPARALPGPVYPAHFCAAAPARLRFAHAVNLRPGADANAWYTRLPRGGVAQWLEQRTHNPQVGGSNPPAAMPFARGDLRAHTWPRPESELRSRWPAPSASGATTKPTNRSGTRRTASR